MTPTPSKPDLVALAERLEKFQQVLESARRQDNKLISVWSDDPIVVAEAVSALRHLASQPSLYETGQRDMRERARLTALAFNPVGKLKHRGTCDGIAAAIAALPADGGEDKSSAEGCFGSLPSGESEPVVTQAPPSAEATPSSPAGSVREAARLAADDLVEICEAAHRVAKRTGNTFVLDRERVAGFIAAKFAALSAPVEAPVAVKPLRWVNCSDGTHHDLGCQYEIERIGKSWRVIRAGTGGASYLCDADILDTAKAAAQADYEQRIRSALIVTTRPLPSVEREALEELLRCANAIVGADASDPHAAEAFQMFADARVKARRVLAKEGSAHGR